ncbi:F-box domain-containing protein [Colletotrichum karsti]|uniref:F-box domain-containing protein n=1 Tax=Colletotrichum karsti TaxID=1095194 RepID=A0A9P6LIU5_9PEZI|nr:F-box domain-containing protein [Colletotrichum karsti]KAF9873977.1 F-box domain-containing protein [Colletotrichum karsti]
MYQNVCRADDRPRSVAICPHRECVAFGCASAIGLFWFDDTTGQTFSRSFPLSTPGDFLYFLPPRPVVDTTNKLRLLSSAASLNPESFLSHEILGAFAQPVGGHLQQIPAVISRLETSAGGTGPEISSVYTLIEEPTAFANRLSAHHEWVRGSNIPLRSASATSSENYRAVPLGDGYHIIFNDPQTGHLCLGKDAPMGPMSRLQRKVQFRAPATASSTAPTAFAVGKDLRDGVRVVAVFPTTTWVEGVGFEFWRQLLVFYTIPPDMFQDISFFESFEELDRPVADWIWWWQPVNTLRAFAAAHNSGHPSLDFLIGPSYPLDVHCQVIAACSGVTELSLDVDLDIIIWAFSTAGWGRCWALDTGKAVPIVQSAIQMDGSLRPMDLEGDLMMPDAEDDSLRAIDFEGDTLMPDAEDFF